MTTYIARTAAVRFTAGIPYNTQENTQRDDFETRISANHGGRTQRNGDLGNVS